MCAERRELRHRRGGVVVGVCLVVGPPVQDPLQGVSRVGREGAPRTWLRTYAAAMPAAM